MKCQSGIDDDNAKHCLNNHDNKWISNFTWFTIVISVFIVVELCMVIYHVSFLSPMHNANYDWA
jgi:uncharacterized membrane protein